MNSQDSITQWLNQLQTGDRDGAQRLWERYFRRLVGLARARLEGRLRRAVDEEDVALSAFDSFFRGAEQGRYPQLGDRDDLWRLLVTITVRKALKQARDQSRRKRGGGVVRGDSAIAHAGGEASGAGLDQVAGNEPSPQFAAEVAEEHERLLARLDDDALRQIALWKLQAYTNAEIAKMLDCSPATVERRLALIRRLWEQEI